MSIGRLYWLTTLLFFLSSTVILVNSKQQFSLFYGIAVGLTNLVLSYLFFYWSQRSVPRRQGYSFVMVLQSIIVRAMIVGGMLVYSFTRMEADGVSVIVGFVLAQFYYLLIQLIGIVKNGK